MFKAQVNDAIGPHALTLSYSACNGSDQKSKLQLQECIYLSDCQQMADTLHDLQNSYATLLIGIRDLQSQRLYQ